MDSLRIFATEEFDGFATNHKLGDNAWIGVVDEMENGLVGDVLGSGAYKKRIARRGAGKSGGFRVIVVFKHEDRVIFVKGYAKNVQPTPGPRETAAYRALAKDLLSLTPDLLDQAVSAGRVREIERHA